MTVKKLKIQGSCNGLGRLLGNASCGILGTQKQKSRLVEARR
jgi:hypothetical protein